MLTNYSKFWTLRFSPNRITFLVFILGLVSVSLGILLNYYKSPLDFFLIRDIFQISLVGIIIPFIILAEDKENYVQSGLRFDKPLKYLVISLVLGVLLAILFITAAPNGLSPILKPAYIGPAVYIMVANIYEVIFFFIFLRFFFEKAFGIIPAIILAALFYSFHHAGFQPQFLKLFIVGLVFISIFRIANHWLICFPLWWIGGLGDVLLQSAKEINPTHINGLRGLFILMILMITFYLKYPFPKQPHLNDRKPQTGH